MKHINTLWRQNPEVLIIKADGIYNYHWTVKGLSPRSKALLGKLTVAQAVKKFPDVYKTVRFITVMTGPHPAAHKCTPQTIL
jgi:hypothetical protein